MRSVQDMTEAELLEEVLAICAENDVLAFHSTDSRRDIGKGFPDLVCIGRRDILFVELKRFGGYRSPEQTTWGYRIIACGMRYALWTPLDLKRGTIESVIRGLV
jgi:hypothetical protein